MVTLMPTGDGSINSTYSNAPTSDDELGKGSILYIVSKRISYLTLTRYIPWEVILVQELANRKE